MLHLCRFHAIGPDTHVRALFLVLTACYASHHPAVTYVLILRLHLSTHMEIGCLGSYVLPAGHYLYVGSAMEARRVEDQGGPPSGVLREAALAYRLPAPPRFAGGSLVLDQPCTTGAAMGGRPAENAAL